jgi:phosphate transport system substrate-binding protein
LKLNPFGAALGVLTMGALIVSGCGNGSNASTGNEESPTPSGLPVKVDCGGKKTLKASGATAQANAMIRFIKAFEQACPNQTLNYTPNGSGAGISEFTGNQTDFGASDVALSPTEYAAAQRRCGSRAWHLPVVFGPIAITYHVKGLSSLVLDAPTTAKIFNGGITTWNDPAIQALNRGANLPAEPIRVVFRSDLSGTSDDFQQYLETASNGAWGKGTGKTFNGGVGEGARGNDGTSSAVRATEGAITYNEWSYAQSKNLSMAEIITSAGPDPVAITADTVGKTIAGAWVSGKGNDLVLNTTSFYKPTQTGAYPIVLATYEIVCSKYPDPQVGMAVKAFLESTIGAGQNGLADNGYVPIPDAWKLWLMAAINAIA